ncbi:hypothetical protein HKI87_04g30280 [Chloropicon roscoffensis]|uniref:Stress-associated endoplasmic reticulum protein n=1 Tax=Chloropicon roscoffensis TaxID=1461544 RepID=A0AAX4P5X5_9CHLO
MPKGASSSGSSQNVQRGGGSAQQRNAPKPAGAQPRGRRQAPTKQKQVVQQSLEGIQVSPLMVLGLSLGLIGVVTFLHIIGKIVG